MDETEEMGLRNKNANDFKKWKYIDLIKHIIKNKKIKDYEHILKINSKYLYWFKLNNENWDFLRKIINKILYIYLTFISIGI